MKRILFLNFYAFSLTGGIEKFNRAFLKGLSDLQQQGRLHAEACSMYDDKPDERYFSEGQYKGFKGKRLQFAFYVLKNAPKYDTIILSHVHLAPIALLVKILFPLKQVILVAHGIEVWGKPGSIQKKFLQKADKILAVSHFTKQQLVEVQGVDAGKITVFPNTIDPYFTYPDNFNKPDYLLQRYSLNAKDTVVFTLTRLSATEKNKGYDTIVKVISQLKASYPRLKYLLSGKYDKSEKDRLDQLNVEQGTTGEVILTGFVKEEEVTDHYLLADVFILPSRKEGFGIVFIEAMACGLPVIAGNKDGSVDALKNGELGLLIDPESEMEIVEALKKCLDNNRDVRDTTSKKELQQKVYQVFGFDQFKKNLQKILLEQVQDDKPLMTYLPAHATRVNETNSIITGA